MKAEHPTSNIQHSTSNRGHAPARACAIGRWMLDVGCWMFVFGGLLLWAAQSLVAEPKPVPRVQAIPEPHDEVSFQRDGVEIARYHAGRDGFRPFVFPVIGPSGRSLTRMGHPHDPVTHSHHNSVWLSHQFVNGVNFWGDGVGHIVQQKLERLEDGPEAASVETLNAWQDKEGKTLMIEHRRTGVQVLDNGEW